MGTREEWQTARNELLTLVPRHGTPVAVQGAA
jgi:hypothetical protein